MNCVKGQHLVPRRIVPHINMNRPQRVDTKENGFDDEALPMGQALIFHHASAEQKHNQTKNSTKTNAVEACQI